MLPKSDILRKMPFIFMFFIIRSPFCLRRACYITSSVYSKKYLLLLLDASRYLSRKILILDWKFSFIPPPPENSLKICDNCWLFREN
jgi:hypothetical protein